MNEEEEVSGIDTRKLMREERKAFGRLKELVRKYRLIIPHVSGRSEGLEEKMSKLQANKDESEGKRKKIVARIVKAEKKIKSLDGQMVEILVKKSGLISQYNLYLEGRLPSQNSKATARDSLADLAIQKEKFLINATKAFSELETKLKELEERKKSIEKQKDGARKRIEDFESKAKMASKKIGLYRADIAAVSKELERHGRNERELKKQYADLVSMMKEVPDMSSWSLKLVEEAFLAAHPKTKIMELSNPVTDNQLPLH